MRIGQNSVSPADVVVDHFGLLFEQRSPSVFLMFDNLGQDFLQALHYRAFGFPESHLIGHLEYIPQRLSAFPVEAPNSQTELIDGLNNGVDLLGQDQPWQMQHRTDPNARAYIGWAGGQVPQFR